MTLTYFFQHYSIHPNLHTLSPDSIFYHILPTRVASYSHLMHPANPYSFHSASKKEEAEPYIKMRNTLSEESSFEFCDIHSRDPSSILFHYQGDIDYSQTFPHNPQLICKLPHFLPT